MAYIYYIDKDSHLVHLDALGACAEQGSPSLRNTENLGAHSNIVSAVNTAKMDGYNKAHPCFDCSDQLPIL